MVHEVVQLLLLTILLLQSAAAVAVDAVVVVDDMFKSSNYSNFVGGGCNLDSFNFNMLNVFERAGLARLYNRYKRA